MAKSLRDTVIELRAENAHLRKQLGERCELLAMFKDVEVARQCARHERDANKRDVRIDRRFVVRLTKRYATQGSLL